MINAVKVTKVTFDLLIILSYDIIVLLIKIFYLMD